MILNHVIIDNIRSYKHEEIEFPKGVSLFVGDIGSGKSTILMAIEFALFGLGSQKAESLLAKKSSSGYVILNFTVDQKEYEIKRALVKTGSDTINQSPKDSWIKIDSQREPLSPSELKQRVLQILKFNEPANPRAVSRIFRYAVFTPQEEMKDVLSDAKMRLETIRKAFRIEDYSIAASNSKELLDEIRHTLGRLEGRFENITILEDENMKFEKEIAELQETAAEDSEEIGRLRQSESNTASELEEIREKDKQRIKTESQIRILEEKVGDAENRIRERRADIAECKIGLEQSDSALKKLLEIKKPDTIKTISEVDAEITESQKLDSDLIRLEAQKKNVSKEIASLRDEIGQMADTDKKIFEEKMSRFQERVKSLDDSIQELDRQQQKTLAEKNQMQARRDILGKEIDKLSRLTNICPTCEQPIDEKAHRDMIESKQEQKEKAETNINAMSISFEETSSRLESTESERKQYRNEIDEIQKIIPNIDKLGQRTAELKEAKIGIASIMEKNIGKRSTAELSKTRDMLIEYKNAMERKDQIEENRDVFEGRITNNEEQILILQESIAENNTKITEIQRSHSFMDLREDILKKESQLTAIRDSISKAEVRLAQKSEKRAQIEENVLRNTQKITESKKWKKRHLEISEYEQWIKQFFIPTIARIEKQVLLSILQNFNETYSRWYSILVDDHTKESSIDEDFAPVVNQDGYEQDVRYLSGGEKTSVALAYRMTLNSLIRKETEADADLLILDEPTDGFSKGQLAKMRDILTELKSEQIILVSHARELEAFGDNMFDVSKYDGVSKVSKK